MLTRNKKPIYESSQWNFDVLQRLYDEIEKIAIDELKLDVYPNQLEVISSEQMLDAYASIGLPIYYNHWSFGKHFVAESEKYRRGRSGLAYEIVINSNPCISYLMEENTSTLQATVIAHACFGHNHFFKNNYLFKQWTDADYIVDYMVFANDYIRKCEERYGIGEVEKFLDSCHALKQNGINKTVRPERHSIHSDFVNAKERQEYIDKQYNDLWRTIPKLDADIKAKKNEYAGQLKHPEENILYFLEKNSPILKTWQREIIRIVRQISQYFYPQMQTKLMNEGFAVFTHHYIMNRLYDEDLIDEGSMLEFIRTHSNIIMQRGLTHKHYTGFNPYALGSEMMYDIKRICEDPTEEDKEWFPDIAGTPWQETLLDAVENYRDESFITQFLSPHLIRKMRLISIYDEEKAKNYVVDAIHDEEGYKKIIQNLSKQNDLNYVIPNVQVVAADMEGDRELILYHYAVNNKTLIEEEARKVITHIKKLWGYKVDLISVDNEGLRLDRICSF